MEKFNGTLVVEQIRGRHGPFCVGMLKTSIGQFKVKDKELDQFEPGSYSGLFLVEEIFTKAVPWRGGTFTELVAKIADGGFLIDEEQQDDGADIPHAQAEPDPVDEDRHPAPIGLPVTLVMPSMTEPLHPKAQPAKPQGLATAPKANTQHDDEKIFGIELYELFAQRAPRIALDTTVDRVQFRAQRERLKATGYQFDAKSQEWVLSGGSNVS